MVSKSLCAHGMRQRGRLDGDRAGGMLVLMKSREPSSKFG